MNVIFLLVVSAYAVIKVVERSEEEHGGSWWRRNEITIVMSLISFIFPMLFELLGLIEYYHPRMQLRLQLARIMSLNLLNLGSLIWALFEKVSGMMKRVAEIEAYQSMMENRSLLEATILPPTSVQTNLPTTMESSTEQTTTEVPIDILTTTDSVIKSITGAIFDRITEIVNLSTSTENPLDDKTDSYEYGNSDYFEEEFSSSNIFSSTTEMPFNDSIIFNDIGNFSMDMARATSEMVPNATSVSNLIQSVTSFLDQYYYDSINESAINETVSDPVYSKILSASSEHLKQDVYMNDDMKYFNTSTKEEMRKLCWETMFGQGLCVIWWRTLCNGR